MRGLPRDSMPGYSPTPGTLSCRDRGLGLGSTGRGGEGPHCRPHTGGVCRRPGHSPGDRGDRWDNTGQEGWEGRSRQDRAPPDILKQRVRTPPSLSDSPMAEQLAGEGEGGLLVSRS